ncbi:MAG: histidine phosphatase family protein [Candidatus Nanopelagicales bacterium]|nr:histidine phosphatase family protein [Candidatus Nanopelagicales bacterium]
MAGCIHKVPSKQLVLIRHAKSVFPVGVDDHDRPLSERGVVDAAAVGQWLGTSGLLEREIAVTVSSARRTQESWELIRGEHVELTARAEPRLYGASPDTIRALITSTPLVVEVLVLIAHNPGLEDLALSIASNRKSTAFLELTRKFPTSGIAIFEVNDWANVAEGNALLTEFLVPRG